MPNKEKYNLQYIKDNNLILFDAIAGSHAHGTNIETSDIDYKGVFCMRQEDYYGLDYIEQVGDEKGDVVYYEIGRFIELLTVNNPTILELLFSPEDCVLYKHPVLDSLFQNKEKFLTKLCKNTFGRYGISQLAKARGQDKLMNWEQKKVSRKGILDFCYVIDGYKSSSLTNFLKKGNFEQRFCGAAIVPHAKDLYVLFFDSKAYSCFSENVDKESQKIEKDALKARKTTLGLGYKGIIKEESESNEIRLSSIPKGEKPICIFSYNKDAYTQHCRDYNKYQNWLKNRNLQRWVDVENHNQKIDGKSLLHCMRLVDVAYEIADGKGLNVKRPNAQELIDIRRGKVDLNTLIKTAEEKITKMSELFERSNLPEQVDKDFANDLLIEIRKNFYSSL